MKSITIHLAVTIVVALATGCAGNPNSSLADQCHNGLTTVYSELDYAKSVGLDGTIEYTKAASLPGAAKIPTASTRSTAPGLSWQGQNPPDPGHASARAC